MLTVELTIEGETSRAEYRSFVECLEDRPLGRSLDRGATCRLWCGGLLLTGKPIDSRQALRDALVQHSRAILRRAIGLSDPGSTTD